MKLKVLKFYQPAVLYSDLVTGLKAMICMALSTAHV